MKKEIKSKRKVYEKDEYFLTIYTWKHLTLIVQYFENLYDLH